MFLSVRAAAAGLIAVSAIAASTQLLADAPAPTSAASVTVTGSSAPTPAKAPDASVPAPGPTGPAAAQTAPAAGEAPTSLDLLVQAALSHRDAPVDSELECMAKAIHHEAANQPLKGQLAVGQVIRNRARSGRFPKSFCAVVNQPGQFFSTARYAVSSDSQRWQTALAVARLAATPSTPQVAPGAMYFHASYVHPGWHRQMVAQIGAHLFYR